MRIGLDFDNTLAVLDHGLARAAAERGIVAPDFTGGRRALYDLVRRLPDADAEWRRIEGRAMGVLMDLAVLADGAARFLARCRDTATSVFVLVHRPPMAAFDPARVDLHRAALDWMEDHGLFAAEGLGIARGQVSFVDTRRAKLDRVVALRLTHFVDTQDEAFREPFFPAGVERRLIGAGSGWQELAAELFRDRN
ncbi:MAG: hypothetical protein ACM31L_04260 [Actinomycetota bacterium]